MLIKNKGIVPKLIAMGCAVFVLIGMVVAGSIVKKDKADLANESMPASSQAPGAQQSVNLIAVGNNLIHDTVIAAGLQADGSYQFDALYAPVKKKVASADIAVIAQETILGGAQFDYSGYPLFNSPWEVGTAVINSGFDVVLCASTHAMDKGAEGVQNAIGFLEKQKDVVYLGINKNAQAYNTIKVIEKNGIKIAMLNYTFGTNGIPLPEDKLWLVNLMDKDKMKQDIEAAKRQADIVIVFPNWGTENSTEISTAQSDLAQFFCENGVQLVIGSHPQVVEPIRWVTAENGNRTLVYYSLGNFMAHQNGVERMLGAMADITITKKDGAITFKAVAVPLVTQIEKKDDAWKFQTYLLKDYTEELAASHKESNMRLSSLQVEAKKVLGDFIGK